MKYDVICTEDFSCDDFMSVEQVSSALSLLIAYLDNAKENAFAQVLVMLTSLWYLIGMLVQHSNQIPFHHLCHQCHLLDVILVLTRFVLCMASS